MNLINTYHGDLSSKLTEIFHEESFWSDKKHFDFLVLHRLDDSLLRLVCLLRVEGCSWDEVGKFLELVGHKRDEGSHHENQAW